MTQQTDGSENGTGIPAQGSAATMEALSLRLRAPLERYFRNRHIPPHEVEDLVQEVFLRLTARPGIETVERLEAYVFATASNLLRDRHRHLTSQAADAHLPYDESVHGSLRPSVEPDRILQGSQLVAQMVTVLYELPERTRAVFSLYHFEECSHAQISEQLGIAISTVEKHMARANVHLLKRMGL